MTNQPYDGSYDPYQQHQQWPDGYEEQQHTQTFQGQTWDTQLQAPTAAPAEETAYLPQQGQQTYGAGPLPPEEPAYDSSAYDSSAYDAAAYDASAYAAPAPQPVPVQTPPPP
ncbi:hypothetical protein P8605_15240, partial [Streptomyces sp. T-3]|nr:hypothetical protein [Streptomyces sp. T-3]